MRIAASDSFTIRWAKLEKAEAGRGTAGAGLSRTGIPADFERARMARTVGRGISSWRIMRSGFGVPKSSIFVKFSG